MKKIFWTSIVWILLILAFVFYMKWINQSLAGWMTNFILKEAPQADNCITMTWEAMTEDEIKIKLNQLEDHMNTIEDLIETQNAIVTPNQWSSDMTLEEEPEPTEEELFDEFKAWYQENK